MRCAPTSPALPEALVELVQTDEAIEREDKHAEEEQEDADPGGERRSWYWLLEGDTDSNGYDHTGEPTSLWGFLRVSLDRGGPGEPEKGEDLDLEGFGFQIHPLPEG